jgi:hypothetical protein
MNESDGRNWFRRKCNSSGLLSSLRTSKPGLIKTRVSLLMNCMRNFLKISRSDSRNSYGASPLQEATDAVDAH